MSDPFRLTPDHEYCYDHSQYKKAKSYMQYALHSGEGIVLITGQPGTGKTVLVNQVTARLSKSRINVATLVAIDVSGEDLLRLILVRFGQRVDQNVAESKSILLLRLEEYLRREVESGRNSLLIVDEAQILSVQALEELRGLANMIVDGVVLLQLFLVGQERLLDTVLSPALEQLHQRITATCHFSTLKEEETSNYIYHRLEVAGWEDNPQIDTEVISMIHAASAGIPRRINLICSRLFLYGMVEEKGHLTVHDLIAVLQDLRNEGLMQGDTDFVFDVTGETDEDAAYT